MFRGEQYALFVDRRKSLRIIAGKLGVDKETVRSRIKRLRSMGFLTGWVAIANPNLFGVKQTVLLFDALSASSKDDLIRKIRLIPGVVLIGNFLGNSMLVILYHDSEQALKKAVLLISRLSGTENMFRYENAFPKCEIALSRTDWNIIKNLQKNSLRPYGPISNDLGLSSRTVKRRLERLVGAKALLVIPKLDLNAIEGTVANLVVGYANPEQRRKVDERILSHLENRLFRVDLNQRTHGFFMLILKNVPQAREISNWMKDLPGVERYRLDLFQERIELWESYHELVENRLAQLLPVAT